MFGKLIGAIVGSHIDRRDGRGGVKGAVIGAAAASLARRSAPAALAIGGLIVASKLVGRARRA